MEVVRNLDTLSLSYIWHTNVEEEMEAEVRSGVRPALTLT